MARISTDEVQHLAALSNITLTDDEVVSLQTDLENILGYVSTLAGLDTSGVEPTYQVTGLENVQREDQEIDYDVSREALLEIAPAQQDNQIKVPKVI